MSVRIDLDKQHSVFTNLDWITGKVVLNIPNEETISAVTVKMEGISRTRLEPPRFDEAPPTRQREKRRAEIEIHRVLYLVQTVFPPENIREAAADSKKAGFTLKPGEYEYPFKLRIPINISCTKGAGVGGGLLHKLSFENGTVDYARDATRHIKGTLPPSLSGVQGDKAMIKYFLKATVNRPSMFKTNLRQDEAFVFLPIEPPRPALTSSETYARRKHEIFSIPGFSKKSIFSNFLKKKENEPPTLPLRFFLEARLPAPPLVVPCDPLPLRILLTKLEDFKEQIMLRSLYISVISTTHIEAHELFTDEQDIVSILNKADLHIPIGDPGSPARLPIELDRKSWDGRSLPDTLSPSFKTCNVSRSYRLQVNVGLSRGAEEHVDVLSLLLPLKVYSGIPPPKQLLAAVVHEQATPPLPGRNPTTDSLKVPQPLSIKPGSHGTWSAKNSPVSSPVSSTFLRRPHSSYERPATPGSSSSTNEQIASTYDDLPPPTYEDAIADEIGPVDGPRRNYDQQQGYYEQREDMHNVR